MLKVQEIYANLCSFWLQSFVLCGCFLTSLCVLGDCGA